MVIRFIVRAGTSKPAEAGSNRIVFQGAGDPLPPSFGIYPGFVAQNNSADSAQGFSS
jgi:cytochrome b561